MNQNEKKLLTINDLIRKNKLSKISKIVVTVVIALFCMPVLLVLVPILRSTKELIVLLIGGGCCVVIFGVIYFFIKSLKKEKTENIVIENGTFRIIEDKIYDKYSILSNDSTKYYIYCKIYGKISISLFEYDIAQKDDIVYLVFYNGKENIENYSNEIDEYKRNLEIIDQSYLSTCYELSPELKEKLISYNESLGETNFNNRTKELINKLEMTKNNIKCKNCNKKYNLKRNDFCPNCGFVNKFDIVDIVHNKEWYANE